MRTTSLYACVLCLVAGGHTTHASLVVSSASGVGVVHSSFSNVTWLQNANLLGSWISARGFDAVVNDIIAAVPTVTVSPSFSPVVHTVVPGDFRSDLGNLGRANFFGATAFIKYLNAISYGGHNQWRLPSANNGVYTNPVLNSYTKAGDFGQLYYDELGSSAGFGLQDPMGIFANEQYAQYWSKWHPHGAPYDYIEAPYGFNVGRGDQDFLDITFPFYVWPVASGTLAAVPEAGGWMMAVVSGTTMTAGLVFRRLRASRQTCAA